ncbi:hypothetical protein C8Q76DRAFT_795988 [Earliella scabrosa]|nr:hypothetical protein C8Q76DRAFT_795988 [Earliella scabrosa]
MSETSPSVSLDAALVVVDQLKTANARLAADMHLDIALHLDKYGLPHSPEHWQDVAGKVITEKQESYRSIARERIREGIRTLRRLGGLPAILEQLQEQQNVIELHECTAVQVHARYTNPFTPGRESFSLRAIFSSMRKHLLEARECEVFVRHTVTAWSACFEFFERASDTMDTAMLPLEESAHDDCVVVAVQSVLAQLTGLWHARMGIARLNIRDAELLSSIFKSRAQDGIEEETLAKLTRPLRDIQNLLVTQQELHTGCLMRLTENVEQAVTTPRSLPGVGNDAQIDVEQLKRAATQLEHVGERMRTMRRLLSLVKAASLRFQRDCGASD